MKKIRLIIFDLDGTLVDAYPAIISSFNYTMQRLGYPRQSALVIRRAVGWGDENLLRPFLKKEDLPLAVSIYRRHHQLSLPKKSRLLPQAAKVLAYLKNKGYRLAVASNRPTRFSRILIRHLELRKYFSYVLCADRPEQLKPRPYILNKIRQRFKLRPDEVLYVGDMATDARAGRAAKVKTVIVTTGSSSQHEIQKERPYLILKGLGGILKIL